MNGLFWKLAVVSPLLSRHARVWISRDLWNHVEILWKDWLPFGKGLVRDLGPEDLRLSVRYLPWKLQALVYPCILEWAWWPVAIDVWHILNCRYGSRLRSTLLSRWPFIDDHSALADLVDVNVVILVHAKVFGECRLEWVIVATWRGIPRIGPEINWFFWLLDDIHDFDSLLGVNALIRLEIWWVVLCLMFLSWLCRLVSWRVSLLQF